MIPVLAVLVSLSQPVADPPNVDVVPEQQMAGYDQRARALMAQYFQHLSGPHVLTQLQRDYAEYVDFFGKDVDRETVLREKARFVRRWPERSYRPRDHTIQVACGEQDSFMVCKVTGLVDFECRSSERHAASAGVARFVASIAFVGDRPQIFGEKSAVVE